MLHVLEELIANVPGIDAAAAEAKLNEAARYIYEVPGIKPPGCEPPGGCC
jgi:hypothetical protein